MKIHDLSKDLGLVDMSFVARSLKTICIETDYQYLRLLSPDVVNLTDIDEMRFVLIVTDNGSLFVQNIDCKFRMIVLNDVKSKEEFLDKVNWVRTL